MNHPERNTDRTSPKNVVIWHYRAKIRTLLEDNPQGVLRLLEALEKTKVDTILDQDLVADMLASGNKAPTATLRMEGLIDFRMTSRRQSGAFKNCKIGTYPTHELSKLPEGVKKRNVY